ncbi:MAG: protein YgfX [Gammaproteobacteria bacterium]
MSKNLKQTLDCYVSPSKRFGLLINGLHGCAVAACWFNALPFLVQFSATIVVVILWWRAKKKWRTRFVHLRFGEGLGWSISHDGRGYQDVTILNSTTVSLGAIFLHYKIEGGKVCAFLVLRDSLSKEDFRRLSVCLRVCGRG